MRRRGPVALVACLALGAALAACSDDESSSTTTTEASSGSTTTTTSTTTTLPDQNPTVAELWTEPTSDSGADVDHPVYATIQGGAEEDSLVGVEVDSDLAAGARLTPEDSVELPATTTVNLTEDSTYIELTGLAAPLEENKPFRMTLEFDTAGKMEVEGAIRNPTDPETEDGM